MCICASRLEVGAEVRHAGRVVEGSKRGRKRLGTVGRL